MNQELLMFMAASNQSMLLDDVVNELFADKPNFIKQQITHYLVDRGIAVMPDPIEGIISASYEIHTNDLITKMIPALVEKYPSLSASQPQIQQMTAPLLEIPDEPQEEKDYRERCEALKKLIADNPDVLERYNGNLVSKITQRKMWETLNQTAGRQLFWGLSTFKIYCGSRNGTICKLIGVKSIVWMQDKAKR
jgi:hypothetical protein